VIREAIRIFKNTTSNHKTVYFGIFLMKFKGVFAIFDVAIDDELSFWADFVS